MMRRLWYQRRSKVSARLYHHHGLTNPAKATLIGLLVVACGCFLQSPSATSNESTGALAGEPVTRSEAVLTAYEFAAVPWTMREENRFGVACNGGFRSDYPVGPRVGMGYKWGGWDSVEEFTRRIREGYGTGTGGNVTYLQYPFACVTGVSCTGLVSRAWHLSEKYTLTYPGHSEIPNQMHEITDDVGRVQSGGVEGVRLKKADAFMNEHHIILFVYETRDGHPMVVDSRNDGVRFRKTTWAELSESGYRALRYHGIVEEENPEGTVTNPIVIKTRLFPFAYHGNTWDVVSMRFDRYPPNRSSNQQGPEVVFRLQMDRHAAVSLRVTEDSTLPCNNDLFLLTSLTRTNESSAQDCIATGDRVIDRDLAAGTYYVIVDSGRDLPGEFTLHADFAANKERGG